MQKKILKLVTMVTGLVIMGIAHNAHAMGDTSMNRSANHAAQTESWFVTLPESAPVIEHAQQQAARYEDIRVSLERWLDQQRDAVRLGYIPQLGVQVRGLWASYEDTKSRWSKYLAYYDRMFTYDTALALYTQIIRDDRRGDFSESRTAVDVIMHLMRREHDKGRIGLLHFSYNTKEDSFIDPRKITGANIWMLKALYAYMIASGDLDYFQMLTGYVRDYLFPLQVLDSNHPAFGFVTAGYGHPLGMDQGGYSIYADLYELNTPTQLVVLEHNADYIDLLRIMQFLLNKCELDTEGLSDELRLRHALVMQAAYRVRKGRHWPTAIDLDGTVNWSMAVDHYTWMASTFIGLDDDVAWQSVEVLNDEFTTTIDSLEILIGPIPRRIPLDTDATGLIFFDRDFSDPYVTIAEDDRDKLENLIQPEATAGGIVFLYHFARHCNDDSRREKSLELLDTWLDGLAVIHETYSSLYTTGGMPYATENTHNYFNSTPSMAATATYYMAIEVLATGYPFFIGVPLPEQFDDALTCSVDVKKLPARINYRR